MPATPPAPVPEHNTVRRVAVIALGGTVAMTSSVGGGVQPSLSADQLLAAVPGLASTGIAVATVDLRRKPGASLSFADLAALCAAIRAEIGAGADGVVVVQGTDTIEETVYLLDLAYAGTEPVVVTGAMRYPTMAGADGPANILAAIQVAASAQASGHGVLVVFADQIHAARQVRKTHATSIAAFTSPNTGPVGHLVEGRPVLLTHPDRLVIGDFLDRDPPAVAVYTITLADDGALLAGAADRIDGLIVAAFGAGHVPESLVPTLTDLAAAIPVILASRTGAGPVLTSTYGFPGSEQDLRHRGLIPAGFLDPLKARLLLHTLLAAGAGRRTIERAFVAAGGHGNVHSWPFAITLPEIDDTGDLDRSCAATN